MTVTVVLLISISAAYVISNGVGCEWRVVVFRCRLLLYEFDAVGNCLTLVCAHPRVMGIIVIVLWGAISLPLTIATWWCCAADDLIVERGEHDEAEDGLTEALKEGWLRETAALWGTPCKFLRWDAEMDLHRSFSLGVGTGSTGTGRSVYIELNIGVAENILIFNN